MLCIPIPGPSLEECLSQINDASGRADLIELRLDLYSCCLEKLLSSVPEGHYVVTLKKAPSQGVLEAISDLKPKYVDLAEELNALPLPGCQVIRSYHNFEETPSHLGPHDKVACMAKAPSDALRLMRHARESGSIGVSMGGKGAISRILSPIVNPITYASLGDGCEVAPGQLSAHQLIEEYRFHQLNEASRAFILIGDPVDQSLSRYSHNRVIDRLGVNAVYLRCRVEESELQSFLEEVRRCDFIGGLSVTMPHKETVVPLLDEGAPVVNTVACEQGQLVGYNTDGAGALRALGDVQPGIRACLVGNGGVAKGIAGALIERGVDVTLFGRNTAKVSKAAEGLGCCAKPLSSLGKALTEAPDLLIHCTPCRAHLPYPIEFIDPSTTVFDTVASESSTALVELARGFGCRVIEGRELFIQQAAFQMHHFFSADVEQAEGLIREALQPVGVS